MPAHLCLSIRFLDPAFHGKRDTDAPEWPPSPFRAFQALVASAARRNGGLTGPAAAALSWLETLPAPEIVAPPARVGGCPRIAVPNNDLDVVYSAWAKGQPGKQPQALRTMKPLRTLWLGEPGAVHFLWQLGELTEEVRRHAEALAEIAGSVHALGWGIDLAIGRAALLAESEVKALEGERWSPAGGDARNGLRVPVPGTLEDLSRRHQRILTRLTSGVFVAPPPLSVFATVAYLRPEDRRPLPVAAFALLKPDASGFRPFDTARRGLTVCGMLRHAARTAAEKAGWPQDRIDAFVLGHGETAPGAGHVAVGPQRFAYLPLPSVEMRGKTRRAVVSSVRRVLLMSFDAGCAAEVAWARRALSGAELIDEERKDAVAVLSLIPTSDNVVRRYVGPWHTWVTVTPVVLPGFDDRSHYRRRMSKPALESGRREQLLKRLAERTEALLRKALVQAGFSNALAERAELEWRKVGFMAGVERVERHGVPDHLQRYPLFHVRARFRDARGELLRVPGPVCIGGGRYVGLGLFVAEDWKE